MEILSQIAQNLLDKNTREVYRTGNISEIKKISNQPKKETSSKISKQSKNKLSIVGITACATGVAHTYIAQKALLNAVKDLKYNVRIETQGQKGQEFKLTSEEIEKADVVLSLRPILVLIWIALLVKKFLWQLLMMLKKMELV